MIMASGAASSALRARSGGTNCMGEALCGAALKRREAVRQAFTIPEWALTGKKAGAGLCRGRRAGSALSRSRHLPAAKMDQQADQRHGPDDDRTRRQVERGRQRETDDVACE